jgi:uncharacterized C2H2 Zn-finger protein
MIMCPDCGRSFRSPYYYDRHKVFHRNGDVKNEQK